MDLSFLPNYVNTIQNNVKQEIEDDVLYVDSVKNATNFVKHEIQRSEMMDNSDGRTVNVGAFNNKEFELIDYAKTGNLVVSIKKQTMVKSQSQTDPRLKFYQKRLCNEIKHLLFIMASYNQQQLLLLDKNCVCPSEEDLNLILTNDLTCINEQNAFNYLLFHQYIKHSKQAMLKLESQVKKNFLNLFHLYEFVNEFKTNAMALVSKFFKIQIPTLIKTILTPIDVNAIKCTSFDKRKENDLVDPRKEKRSYNECVGEIDVVRENKVESQATLNVTNENPPVNDEQSEIGKLERELERFCCEVFEKVEEKNAAIEECRKHLHSILDGAVNVNNIKESTEVSSNHLNSLNENTNQEGQFKDTGFLKPLMSIECHVVDTHSGTCTSKRKLEVQNEIHPRKRRSYGNERYWSKSKSKWLDTNIRKSSSFESDSKTSRYSSNCRDREYNRWRSTPRRYRSRY